MNTIISDLSSKEFEPNRSKKHIVMFTIVLGLMLLGGLFILLVILLDPNHRTEMLPPGIFMTLLGGAYYKIVIFTKNKYKYFIDKTQIILSDGKIKLPIKYSEIETIDTLLEEEAEEKIKKIMDNATLEQKVVAKEAFENLSLQKLKETFKLHAESFNPYKFLSVRMVFGQSRVSGQAYKTKINLPCDCVYIKLKDGKHFFISPLDCMGFVNETKRYLRK